MAVALCCREPHTDALGLLTPRIGVWQRSFHMKVGDPILSEMTKTKYKCFQQLETLYKLWFVFSEISPQSRQLLPHLGILFWLE